MAAQAETVTRPISQPADTAFDRLFIDEYRRVVAIAQSIVGDSDEAQDIAQEAFTAFHRRHDPSALFGPVWLHRAATHLALNAVRSRKRRAHREQRDAVAQLRSSPASISTDPQARLVTLEDRRQVRHTLSKLPRRSAQVLALRYSGLSYAEVAAAMNCRIGDVGTMLRRAEAAFRKEYQP